MENIFAKTYFGKKDIHGEEIYTGHLVECDVEWNRSIRKLTGAVEYDEERCYFCVHGHIINKGEKVSQRYRFDEVSNIEIKGWRFDTENA